MNDRTKYRLAVVSHDRETIHTVVHVVMAPNDATGIYKLGRDVGIDFERYGTERQLGSGVVAVVDKMEDDWWHEVGELEIPGVTDR